MALASAPAAAIASSTAATTTAVASTATAVAAAATTITAAAAAIAAATSAPTTATRTGFARARFVYGERPTFDGFAVEVSDRFLRVGFIAHRDKSEATGFTGEFILHESDLIDRPGLCEEILEVGFSRIEGKISYV